jgi:hypothetical protein
MRDVLGGLSEFCTIWVGVCVELIKEFVSELPEEAKPNFNRKSPVSPCSLLPQIEMAALFVTAANRAIQHEGGVFEVDDFAPVYLDADLHVHGWKVSDLTPSGRDRQVKRINTALRRDMSVLVSFKLFDEVRKGKVYKLTKRGEEIFARFKPESSSNFSVAAE